MEKEMIKIKCPKCGATLFFVESAVMQIKCYRCKTIIDYEIKDKSVKHTVQSDRG